MKRKTLWGCLVWMFLLSTVPLFAAQNDLMAMSLEDLLSMPVTSSAGREQKKNEVAAAMTVITKEDIQRSGAHNIPDLFYRVPGMQVRKIDSRRYLVGIRGAGSFFQGYLLTLIDGVVVFNPVSNGTNWELLPVTLDEIERIEIIRGPGGVLYSSNAVEGVVNIITKKAAAKDNYVSIRGGSMSYLEEKVAAGGTNDKLSVRAWADNNRDRGFDKLRSGDRTANPTRSEATGLKVQYDFTKDASLVLDGKFLDENSINSGRRGSVGKNPGMMRAIDADYNQKVSDAYDYNIHIDHVASSISYTDSLNIDAYTAAGRNQHNLHFSAWGEHVASAGAEIRWNKMSDTFQFDPPSDPKNTEKVDSLFFQDEYRPVEKLILTAGVRSTRNSFFYEQKGLIYEPRVSAVYKLNDKHSLRAIASQTYKAPNFTDVDMREPAGPFDVVGTVREPEKVLTYELGWQGLMLNDKLSMDTSVFYSDIKDPIFGGPIDFGAGVLPIWNNGSTRSCGLEWESSYKLSEEFALKSDYAYLNVDPRPNGPVSGESRGQSTNVARHQVGTGIGYTKNDLTCDVYVKWIGKAFDNANLPTGKLPSYFKTFIRLGYAFKMPGMRMQEKDAELELVANDLFDARTTEATPFYFREPDVYAGLKIKF